jgi:cytochrome c-type biogenesis protein CcmH
MIRRQFIARVAAGLAAVVATDRARAQATAGQAPGQGGASNLATMDQDAARSVRRPPKPNGRPQLTDRQRDDQVERNIRCQCGCTLDVYTCRTTDFACQVSPAMHGDIKALVEGGYTAQEILDSFVDTYGERALMAPRPRGFNLFGYAAPFLALAAGAVAVAVVLRGWGAARNQPAIAAAPSVDATPDELARLDAAIRSDD